MLLKVCFQPHMGKAVPTQSREKFWPLAEAGGCHPHNFLPSDCSGASPPLFSASATTSVLWSLVPHREQTHLSEHRSIPNPYFTHLVKMWLPTRKKKKFRNFLLVMSEEFMIPLKV